MNRGVWQATVHGITESNSTEVTEHARKVVFKNIRRTGTSLAVQWLTLHTSNAGVREVRSYMPSGMAKKVKKKKFKVHRTAKWKED